MSPSDVEDAIITTLKSAAEDSAYYVASYEGRAGSDEELANWIASVQLPAVAVFYAGSQYDPNATDELRQTSMPEASYVVWVIHDRLRGYETAMKETGGVHEILNIIFKILQGSNVGVAIEPLSIMDEIPVGAETLSGRVIWQQTYQTSFVRT